MVSGRVEESIKYSITKNGFPKKKVKLPFRPVFDCCKQNNTFLGDVLGNLAKENIFGKIKGDYIEFKDNLEVDPQSSGPSGEQKADGVNLQKSAIEMLSNMTPDQIAHLRGMVESLSDEEKKSFMDMMVGENKLS